MRTTVIPSVAFNRNDTRLQALRGKGLSGGERERERLEETALEFEALLLEMMVKEMRKNVPESPLLGESRSREIFSEMLDGEYVRMMVQRGGLGLSKMLVKQLGADL